MRAGQLDRQITIERKQATVDPTYGTELITWVPLVAQAGSPTVAQRFWAQVQDVLPSRSEVVTQGLAVARNQSRLRMRYRGDVTSDMRVTVHGATDVVMQIVGGPSVLGRNEWLEMVLERYSS